MTTNSVIPFGAAPKDEKFGDTHEGNVVSLVGDRLVVATIEGNEYSFRVASDASVSCDGTACQIEDLKVRSKVRLTTKDDNKNVVTKIDSLVEQAGFPE